jgi:hypothetical protein
MAIWRNRPRDHDVCLELRQPSHRAALTRRDPPRTAMTHSAPMSSRLLRRPRPCILSSGFWSQAPNQRLRAVGCCEQGRRPRCECRASRSRLNRHRSNLPHRPRSVSSRAMAARSSGMPPPPCAEVASVSGNAAGCRLRAAVVASRQAASSAGFTSSALVSTT